jgi:hypothetical protein
MALRAFVSAPQLALLIRRPFVQNAIHGRALTMVNRRPSQFLVLPNALLVAE